MECELNPVQSLVVVDSPECGLVVANVTGDDAVIETAAQPLQEDVDLELFPVKNNENQTTSSTADDSVYMYMFTCLYDYVQYDFTVYVLLYVQALVCSVITVKYVCLCIYVCIEI